MSLSFVAVRLGCVDVEVLDWVEEEDLVSAPFPGALCVEVVVTVPSESGWVDGGV